MPRYRITISSPSGPAMTDLVRKYNIAVLDHGGRRGPGDMFSTDAIVEEADIQRLRDAGYTVERHDNVDETGKARQKEVGRGDRYKKDRPN
jgi:hypothetical protein